MTNVKACLKVGGLLEAFTSSHQHNFSKIPLELKRLPRWVLSKSKKPYFAQAVNSLASPTDPETWTGFEVTQTAFEEGGYDGIGIVFNGDGLVGIDLDDCVVNGKPVPSAVEILDELGCEYVEYSISGQGLHAYGYYDGVPLKGCRKTFKGVKTELYCKDRFFIVTGNIYRQGGIPKLDSFASFHEQVQQGGHSQPTTEDTKAITSVSSVSSVSSVKIPSGFIPSHEGERHDCIFRLARHFKAIKPNANDKEIKDILREWWALAETIVGTKDFDISLVEFLSAWDKVKYPTGLTWLAITSQLPKTPEENPGSFAGVHGQNLYNLCELLDENQRKHFECEPFMLGCRKAAEALNIDYQTANLLLNKFVKNGLLEMTKLGSGHLASRYRLKRREK
jgi:hypothetical protein